MEEEGAVGELEEEEGVERSRLVWARWARALLHVVVSDSEEELEVPMGAPAT